MSLAQFDDLMIAPVRWAPVRRLYGGGGKRALDVAVVLALAPIVLPVIMLLAILTAGDGRGAFYRQTRIGRHGKVFGCWKIRTMVPDADALLTRMIREDAGCAAEWRTSQKLTDDPRITRLGRFLRRSSLDELPQLWNVLRGEMSLIGPRPFTPAQKPLYDALPAAPAYYGLRPGISGLWQVGCRNSGGFGERARYDHAYAQTLSLGRDLRIAGRTILVVLRATGR